MGAGSVIVTPERRQHKQIGQALLVLAAEMGLPATVVTWTTWPVAGYRIPAALFERFENPDTVAAEPVPEPGSSPVEQPKRRGRPRKHVAVEDSDNNHSEEE